MIHIKENSTLVGISELRTKMNEILSASRKNKVIVEKHRKPFVVLVDAEKYAKMEERLDFLEDYALGHLAKIRDKGSKDSDYVDIEDALKSVVKK